MNCPEAGVEKEPIGKENVPARTPVPGLAMDKVKSLVKPGGNEPKSKVGETLISGVPP